MGTRGAFGVRINGQDKITYNHFDSYPEGLGRNVLTAIRDMHRDRFDIKAAAERLVTVSGYSQPTQEQKDALKPYTDLGVSKQSDNDWYCLTRKLQGELYETLKAGVMTDSRQFMHDSLFCEYAYIVNLDDGVLEFYRGFQQAPHSKGRYWRKEKPKADYYGVALEMSIPLSEIQAMGDAAIDKLVGDMEPAEEAETT